MALLDSYIAELNSILIPNDGFHTDLVSEKMKILLEIFQEHMLPILRDMFRKMEQNIVLLGEEVFGGDAVEAIAEELEQEKTALMDMKQFMTKLLQLMQDSSDASREADTGYERAVRNLGQGN